MIALSRHGVKKIKWDFAAAGGTRKKRSARTSVAMVGSHVQTSLDCGAAGRFQDPVDC